MERYVARPLGDEGSSEDEDMKAIESNVQGLANSKKPGKQVNGGAT
jgi:hypothetical protein